MPSSCRSILGALIICAACSHAAQPLADGTVQAGGNAQTGSVPIAAAGSGVAAPVITPSAGANSSLPLAGMSAAAAAGSPPLSSAGRAAPTAGGGMAGMPASAGQAATGAAVGGMSGMLAGAGPAAGGGGVLAAGSPAATNLPALRVAGSTSTIELAPVLLAAQSVYAGKASVSNGGIANLFGGGAADVATNAETQALRQSVDHADLRIILTVCEGFYRIVARRSTVPTLADLRGKSVATLASTSSAYYLHKMLQSAGLTDSDVNVVGILGSAASSLQSRQVDAVTIWEPDIQRALDALGSDAIEFQDRTVYRELFNLHATAEELSDATKRRGIVEFVRSLIVASEEIRNHPEDVWPLVAKTTGYDQALIQKVWSYEGYPSVIVPDLLDVLEDEEGWLAKESNRAPRSRTQLAMLIDDSVVRDAMAKL